MTNLPVSWRSLGDETVTFRLSSLRKMGRCIKPADNKWYQDQLLADKPGGRVLPAASHLSNRNEGRKRGENLPILPESGDTMAVTPFASKRGRKQSPLRLWMQLHHCWWLSCHSFTRKRYGLYPKATEVANYHWLHCRKILSWAVARNLHVSCNE